MADVEPIAKPTRREYGLLGLPKDISLAPEQRKADFNQAIKEGYKRIEARFGKLAASPWQPNDENIKIFDDTDAYMEEVAKTREDREDYFAYLPNRDVLAYTAYRERKVFYNIPKFTEPLGIAASSAHETIHVWAGKQQIEFGTITNEALRDPTGFSKMFLQEMANELLVDFCAYEALGLLEYPITRLPSVDMIRKAFHAMIVKQLALGLGTGSTEKAFKLTQGTLTVEEISAIDKKMGANPSNGRTGFCENGFLFVLGNIGTAAKEEDPKYQESNNKLTTSMFYDSVNWIAARTGERKLKFVGRPDVLEAQKILIASRGLGSKLES